jgi:Zn-dependent M28 family amino/carboxypeptidase
VTHPEFDMRTARRVPGILAALLIGACALTPAGRPDGAAAISEAGYRTSIATLASDAFEGRKPGQPGEQQTLDYLEREFRALGLKPAVQGGYRQAVPLVEITALPGAELKVAAAGGSASFAYADDMVVWTKRVVPESGLEASPLVFVGHGIVAPEFDWNDYAGVDMHGKTAVILVNDPGFRDPALFHGRKMTYYGRWTYKYEEAMRQGAAGALIVHQTGPAAYGWEVVRNSNTGPLLEADSADGHAERIAIEGWVTLEAARRAFALAGQDFDALERAAARPGFHALPLSARATVAVRNTVRRARSANVIGIVPGARRPNEYVLYMAHWDHFGRSLAPGTTGDPIYHGAVDNATGVAAILEIARAFGHARRPPDRSVVFLALTGEEQGLLGSAHYAAHPVFPLAATAAAINIDALLPVGRTRDVEVIGFGASELEDALGAAAARQGRVLRPDSQPEKGFFFRSDHFNLAKLGVPALYVKSGVEARDHPAGWVEAQVQDYIARRYHKPADTYDPAWDVAGSLEDIELLYAVGREVANQRRWPAWYPSSEFRAAREASRPPASR